MSTAPATPRRDWVMWAAAIVAAAGIVVVLWASITEWGGVVHGNPAYALLLGLTLLACAAVLLFAFLPRKNHEPTGGRWRSGWRRVVRIILVVLATGFIALIAWLRPHTAEEPALAAMKSDAAVTITESPTEIVMTPTGDQSTTGVFFQPGALVDARAYAAVLRPLAEAGHTVVIPKQPLGIAFLALGAFDEARPQHPDVTGWVVGGHSLGGTVAAIQAEGAEIDTTAPATGLLFFASYPATDMSTSLTIPVESISGTQDGLATPENIDASRTDLPADTAFTIIDGASHAQFGSYGPQPGDNTPEISNDDARTQISEASLAFVDSVTQ
ncbi:hypothetical protein FHX49_000514 [Microbacterium endophyticum]|uniref:Alpha/beta hydrolase fold-5 domain-containing protein n=1 Tax=Microbacterium endophyticum TaxID=1526412 RepID=A0A7W4V2J1_9MICO|nr:alpha/beta hydrolase [Microbacterium endophyticum]MBB2974973.1 hypothetical protein [Microbacterium endophyticum]NIK37270.1 hypothetical protein [Microbacterium endophyticum]